VEPFSSLDMKGLRAGGRTKQKARLPLYSFQRNAYIARDDWKFLLQQVRSAQ
jgi:hypothetical protein